MLPGKTIITTDTSLAEIKKNVRNKAIDEFAERLRDVSFLTHENYLAIWLDSVEEIAEEMKGSDEFG